MKRFRIQLVIAGIVLVCGVSLMGLVYIVFNKPETYITPGIVTSNTPASESPLSNPNASVTQQTYPPRATVHYPTKTYKGTKPVSPSSVRGVYLTSSAQVQTVGGGFAHNTSAETSQSSSSRGIVYSTSGAGMPTTNFLALASQRQVAEPESQEAPQMAHLASSDPRHAPGPPDPGELPGDHQLVEHPIGDGMWCLLLLAIGYAAMRLRRKKV
ncbi:MAG: hypothetical protein IJP76_06250 [Paludibacteraceae bacterium]|nr:hypothetical protein [Paludibacteraceae bacterium]